MGWTLMHTSEIIMMTLNPCWADVDLDLDPTLPLVIKVSTGSLPIIDVTGTTFYLCVAQFTFFPQ
jgi:hypothetical protein